MSIILTCHESRCLYHDHECLCHDIRGGPPPSKSSPKSQPNASNRSMAFFGLLLDQYSVAEAEELTWITLTILREWSSRPLFTRGFDIANLLRKFFATLDLSNRMSMQMELANERALYCAFYCLLWRSYDKHCVLAFCEVTTQRLICLRQWRG